MDMAFATSLGISEAGLKALMRDAGFRPADAPVEKVEEPTEAVVAEEAPAVEAVDKITEPAVIAEAPDAPVPEESAAAQPVVLTHWRWIGLPKPRPQEQRQPRPRPDQPRPQRAGKPNSKPDRAPPPPKPASPPSALALQLAALKGLKL
jgi:hypothetical protein